MKSRQESDHATPRSRMAEQYVIKNPTKGNMTIARMLVRDHPDLFYGNINNTRTCVRRIRGAGGDNNKTRRFPVYSMVDPNDLQPDDAWQTPYKIADSIKRIGVISDLHGVFMDKEAFDLAIHTLQKEKVESLLINGDLLDNHWLGRWIKNPVIKRLPEEMAFMKKLVGELSKRFKNVYFKEGNHDAWLERRILTNSPEFAGVEEFTLPHLLGLKDFKVHHVHNLQEIKFGDLSILHGHEKPGFFTPMLVAKSVITWWQAHKREPGVKVMVSHFHTVDNFVQRDPITGTFAYGYVTGCLAKLKMDYHPYARRNHGIAIVDNCKGETEVRNFEI